jgi:hypothetical protein
MTYFRGLWLRIFVALDPKMRGARTFLNTLRSGSEIHIWMSIDDILFFPASAFCSFAILTLQTPATIKKKISKNDTNSNTNKAQLIINEIQ